MENRTGNAARENRERVMRAILEHGSLSRTEIAQVSGLSPSTVTRMVACLMTEGVLAEDTTRVRTEGRSRIPVVVNESYGQMAIACLSSQGVTLYRYDMALEPCAEPVTLDCDGTATDLLRAVSQQLTCGSTEFARTLRAMGVLRCDDAWDAVGGLSDLLSRRLGVPVFERRAEDCAEYQITHDEGESANKNHALVSLGTEALVGIAQGGRQVAFRRGAYANLSQRLAGMGECEASIVDRLVDALSLMADLFTIDAIFMMSARDDLLLCGVPVRLDDVVRAGNRAPDLPRVVVVSQTSKEMSRIMTAQVRSAILCAG